MRVLISLIFLCLFISACRFKDKFQLPEIEMQKGWQTDSTMFSQDKINDRWWEYFQDNQLNNLVDLAIANNLDILIAKQNFLEARTDVKIARSVLLPDISADFTADKFSNSERVNSFNLETERYDAYFDTSWEIDFWGGINDQKNAAKNRYYSDIYAYRAMIVSVVAEVTRNYIELRGAQKRLDITQKNINLLQEIINLTQVQQAGGIATNFDVARAISEKKIEEANLPNLKATIYQHIYSLSALAGKDPSFLLRELQSHKILPEVRDIVPVGLPAQLLTRRPDLRQAEYLLAAAIDDKNAALTDFLPNISLTGQVGNASLKFSDLYSSASGFWNIGAEVNLPFFRGGELIAEYEKAKLEVKETIYNYRKVVLTALAEVESALIVYAQEIETNDRLKLAVKNSEKVLYLATERYKAGLDDFLAVIAAERDLIDLQNRLVINETDVHTSFIALLKSLGGGWTNYSLIN